MSRLSLAIGSAIIVAWLLTIGVLLKNHYLHPEQIPEFENADLFTSVEVVERWKNVEEFMLILQNNDVVGASATTISKSLKPDKTMTYLMQFALSAKLSPILPTVNVKVSAGLDSGFNLTKFHGIGNIGSASLSATGKISEQTLQLKIANGSNISLRRIALPNSVSLAEAVRPALGKKLKIAPGNQTSIPVLDPLSGRNRGTMTIKVQDKEGVKVNGRIVKAHRVVSDLHDIKTTMWVDSDVNTLKRQLVGNLVMERTSATEALSKFPQLNEPITIPDLDSAEFANVPLTQPGSPPQASSGPGLLDSLLR